MVLLKYLLEVLHRGQQSHLHSTMVLLKFKMSITLYTGSPSTFHYGSIKILFDKNQVKFNKSSTFHYGSIKIIRYKQFK